MNGFLSCFKTGTIGAAQAYASCIVFGKGLDLQRFWCYLRISNRFDLWAIKYSQFLTDIAPELALGFQLVKIKLNCFVIFGYV